MTKWNNLFKSLMYKHEVGITLDVYLITDRRNTVQENLALYTERFLEGKGKVDPIYSIGRAAGKSGLAMAEFGKALGKLSGKVPHV